MLLPVRVVVAFVAHGALMRVRADVSAHILNAHDAQRTVLGSANVIVHVVSAANAAAGARGFSRVVLSGAHACMIPRRCPLVNAHARTFFNNTAGPSKGPAVWLVGRRWAYISPHPALASQSLSASQSSGLIRLAASMNAELSAAYSSSCCLRAARLASSSRSRCSSHIGHSESV